jgi:hypothetical protein
MSTTEERRVLGLAELGDPAPDSVEGLALASLTAVQKRLVRAAGMTATAYVEAYRLRKPYRDAQRAAESVSARADDAD